MLPMLIKSKICKVNKVLVVTKTVKAKQLNTTFIDINTYLSINNQID